MKVIHECLPKHAEKQAPEYGKVRSAVILRNTTNKCVCRYVNLLYYKQRNLLKVSAICLWSSSGKCTTQEADPPPPSPPPPPPPRYCHNTHNISSHKSAHITLSVFYILTYSAMPRREDHEVHKDMWGIGKKIF